MYSLILHVNIRSRHLISSVLFSGLDQSWERGSRNGTGSRVVQNVLVEMSYCHRYFWDWVDIGIEEISPEAQSGLIDCELDSVQMWNHKRILRTQTNRFVKCEMRKLSMTGVQHGRTSGMSRSIILRMLKLMECLSGLESLHSDSTGVIRYGEESWIIVNVSELPSGCDLRCRGACSCAR